MTPGLFEVMGIDLVEGRAFTEADDQTGATGRDSSISGRLAHVAWPIGRGSAARRRSLGYRTSHRVGHGRRRGEAPAPRSPVEEVREQVYFPQRQIQRNPSIFVVRATTDAAGLAASVARWSPASTRSCPSTMSGLLSDYVARARATRRFTTMLATLFAIVALALCAVGVYGVVAYWSRSASTSSACASRSGRGRGRSWRWSFARACGWPRRALAVGLAGAAVATWWFRGQILDGVSPWDFTSYSVRAAVLLLVAVMACVIPARRALATSPVDALRAD